MFNQYPFYYRINPYSFLPSNFIPIPHPQFFPAVKKFIVPTFNPNPLRPQEVIEIDDDSQHNKSDSDCQIIESPEEAAKPSTKPPSPPKKPKDLTPINAANPGRWTAEEHERFVEG